MLDAGCWGWILRILVARKDLSGTDLVSASSGNRNQDISYFFGRPIPFPQSFPEPSSHPTLSTTISGNMRLTYLLSALSLVHLSCAAGPSWCNAKRKNAPTLWDDGTPMGAFPRGTHVAVDCKIQGKNVYWVYYPRTNIHAGYVTTQDWTCTIAGGFLTFLLIFIC